MSRAKVALISLMLPTVIAVVYFVSAGRTDLPTAWSVVGVLVVMGAVMTAWGDRELMGERAAPGGANRDQRGQRIARLLLVASWVISGLDAGRLGWTPVPMGLRWAGAAGYAISIALLLWAVMSNRFYSSAVRVQSDRGQVTVERGPYRFVRHPGYAATLLGAATGGLALGSWVGMTPLLGVGVLFLHRLDVEDAMLRAELPGYADYAARVRYRLLPGVY